MDTFGSAFDTVLAVYTNNPPGSPTVSNLVRVANNDDDSASGTLQSKLQFTAIAGVTYQIAVDGYSFSANDFGRITFHMNLVRVRPGITAQPLSRIVNPGDGVTFSVTATGTAPLTYQWRFNGGVISGANASSYVLNNAQPTNAGNYTVTVANTVGSTNSAIAVLTVRPRLIALSATNGLMRFTLLGTPGLNYAIESSSYLTSWTTLTNMSNVAPQSQFTDPTPPGSTNRFYRARLFP
jgi:hypothetical protein